MNSDLISVLIVIGLGTTVFCVARASRRKYENDYGKPSGADKRRFLASLTFFVLLFGCLMSYWPAAGFTLAFVFMIVPILVRLSTQPGIVKDFCYSGVIISVVSVLYGVLRHGM